MVKVSFGGPLRKLLSKTNSPVLVVWVMKQVRRVQRFPQALMI